jgi:predicted membrane protein
MYNVLLSTQVDDEQCVEVDSRVARDRPESKVGLAVIMLIEMMKGVAFYTILPNVVLFCRDDLNLSKTESVIIYLTFSGQ